jgi:hypothetical protein
LEPFTGSMEKMMESNFKLSTHDIADLIEIKTTLAEKHKADSRQFGLMMRLERILDKIQGKRDFGVNEFLLQFFGSDTSYDVIQYVEIVSPTDLGLLVLFEFFNSSRFEQFDKSTLDNFDEVKDEFPTPTKTYANVDAANKMYTVPAHQSLFLEDSTTKLRFWVNYSNTESGLRLVLKGSEEHRATLDKLSRELRDCVLDSKYIKGRCLEITAGGFQFLDLSGAEKPVMEPMLEEEIDKNIFSQLRNREALKKHNMPIGRSIAFDGLPGTGKTLLSKWIAKELQGEVTTLWVTSKAIGRPSDVTRIFSSAAKLSPCLVVMEDMDLISGTRIQDKEILGELLAQLDGARAKKELFFIGTTNKIHSLDEALKDRHGRLDRIYSFGHPSIDVGVTIAKNYLLSHGYGEDQIQTLVPTISDAIQNNKLSPVSITELMHGAILEAVRENIPLSAMSIRKSLKSMTENRCKVSQ